MNGFLIEAFGENGPGIGQFAVTALVILLLAAIVYWIGRRVWRERRGGTPRGRMARLAVVDALHIDNRRRLLLVRRDAVEHLILIGGPADLVVEPSIVRARQRGVQPSSGAQTVLAPQPVPAPASQAASAPVPVLRSSSELRQDETQASDPSRRQSPADMPGSRPGARNGADPEELGPPPGWFANRDPLPARLRPVEHESHNGGLFRDVLGGDDVTPFLPPPGAADHSSKGSGAAAQLSAVNGTAGILDELGSSRVAELEAEMNRMLGQFGVDHRSP